MQSARIAVIARSTGLRQTSSTDMTHQVAGASVNPSRCSQHLPVLWPTCRHDPLHGWSSRLKSSTTQPRTPLAETSSSLLACAESSTEVPPLVCALSEAFRLFLGITVAIGTEGSRVERRHLLSSRCLCRWIGTLVLGICAMERIRDDPVRQHGNAECLHLGWTGQVAT